MGGKINKVNVLNKLSIHDNIKTETVSGSNTCSWFKCNYLKLSVLSNIPGLINIFKAKMKFEIVF